MSCPTPDELVRLADGELPVNDARAMEAHLAACSSCRSAHARVRVVLDGLAAPSRSPKSDVAFLHGVMEHVERLEASRILEARPGPERQAPPEPSSSWWRLLGRGPRLAPLVLAAAAVVLVAVPLARRGGPRRVGRGGDDTPPASPTWQARGGRAPGGLARRSGAEILIVRGSVLLGSAPAPIARDASTPGALPPPDTLRADDGLAVRVTNLEAGAPVYLLAFAVDAAGATHWLYPAYLDAATDPAAVVVEPGARQKLLGEVTALTDVAPGPVRLVTVLSFEARRVKDVERLLAGTRSDTAVAGLFPGDVTTERLVQRDPAR